MNTTAENAFVCVYIDSRAEAPGEASEGGGTVDGQVHGMLLFCNRISL